MPTFQYRGQTITVDTLDSYARVSSAQSTIAHDGESIPRQIEMHHALAAEFNIPIAVRTRQFIDEGKSGSKGVHLRDGGALYAYMKLATSGKLGPNPGLTVESFSRLSRLPIDLAMGLFLDIIGAGVALFTLTDGNVYTRESVRANHGQMYQVTAGLQAARATAEATSGYSKKSWGVRRGTVTALTPSWFRKYAKKPTDTDFHEVSHFKALKKNFPGVQLEVRVDPDKHAIIQRIFTDVLSIGLDRLARDLNQQGVPTFAGKGHSWSPADLGGMVRGRMVLGEQRIGKCVEGVASKTDQWVKAYSPVVTEDQWLLANAALDSRKKGGVATGRNVTRMTNLFGDLARCGKCGGRMKVKQKGRVGQFHYFACSRSGVGTCDVKKYHRLDQVESRWLRDFDTRALGDWTAKPVEDKAATLKAQIATATTEAAVIQRAYKRALLQEGDMAAQTAADFAAEHAAKLEALRLLERQLTAALAAKPADEQIDRVKELAGVLDGLEGEDLISARRQIAAALPSFVRQIRFMPDGSFLDYRDGYHLVYPADLAADFELTEDGDDDYPLTELP
jgi:hypothetical protein